MKLLNRSQKGFTLIELLIALPIIAIVVAAATGALIQVIQSTSTSAHMVALRQVQTAGYWVSKDGIQAKSVTTGAEANSGFPLNLSWTDYDNNTHDVEYSLQDIYLQRKEIVNSEVGNPIITMVGQYIDPDYTSCKPFGHVLAPDEVLTFTVTAKVAGARGPQTETRTYEIKPRPGS